MANKLVYNIEPASPSMISSLDRHCLKREPDGASNIVPERSHLNRILEGDEGGLMASLKKLYEGGVKKPAAQSESPYLRIVLSASPEYFRPDDPAAVGTWAEDRLAAWENATMNQLRAEHGADLIFAELHLDEDTPHIHAVVAPTYLKKARVPGKQKRGETPEQFEERKAIARASEGVRTVGRASHPTLSKQGSFQRLRQHMAVAVDHLGIEYGQDRAIDAPAGQSTREWVIQKAAKLREQKAELERQRKALEKERAEFEADKEQAQAELDKTMERVERAVGNLSVAIDQVQNGTYDKEISSQDMTDKPKQFEVLKNAAPDNRPTLGFQAQFWSLNFSDGSGPIPFPKKILTPLTKAFDRVATWASEVRQSRLEAQETTRAATEAAEALLASTEASAEEIMQEARLRADHWGSKDDVVRGWHTFTGLIKDKIREVFGDDGYQQVADSVNEIWHTHEDNPNRPLPKPKPSPYSSGPSGP